MTGQVPNASLRLYLELTNRGLGLAGDLDCLDSPRLRPDV